MIRTFTVPGDSTRTMLFLHGMGAARVPAFGSVATDPAFDGRLRHILRLVEIQDAGHNMMADNHRAVVDAITDFVGGQG